jgi:hypothetical protein
MISSSLRGMDSQRYKYKYNIADINDRVIILTLFYVYWLKMCRSYRWYRLLLWFDVSYINELINGMNKNEMNWNTYILSSPPPQMQILRRLKIGQNELLTLSSFLIYQLHSSFYSVKYILCSLIKCILLVSLK